MRVRVASMKGWLKDMKERKKERVRAHNAQAHAALSVAGVAAALAAAITTTSSSSSSSSSSSIHGMQMQNKAALASAAALVAAQCVEMAERMGADRHQLSSLLTSAVSIKSSGDLTTLTAAAATGMLLLVFECCQSLM